MKQGYITPTQQGHIIFIHQLLPSRRGINIYIYIILLTKQPERSLCSSDCPPDLFDATDYRLREHLALAKPLYQMTSRGKGRQAETTGG